MARFTIIGTGKMGSAIGTTPIDGDVVILAVPYPAVAGILSAYGDQLRGKVVVDISNPLNFETFDSLVVPVGSSAAAEIAAQLPDSHVLKAFNTNFAATLAAKQVGGQPTAVLIAGDDAAAKELLGSASMPAACRRSMPGRCPAPTSSRPSASSSSRSPSARSSPGPAASP